MLFPDQGGGYPPCGIAAHPAKSLPLCECVCVLAGVYVPAQQYEEECAERRQLAARVEEMEAEAEAVGAQHELAKAEWEREMGQQAASYEKQLGQVRCQLAATREELEAARVAIQEREYAIAAQQRCEAALAGHAGALNAALAGAATDVAQLFQRWDEKNEVEDANLALVQVRELRLLLRVAVGCRVCMCAAAQLVAASMR